MSIWNLPKAARDEIFAAAKTLEETGIKYGLTWNQVNLLFYRKRHIDIGKALEQYNQWRINKKKI